MEEQSRQERWLILLAAAVCAVIIGYNAFYVPDATVTWASSSQAAAADSGRGDGPMSSSVSVQPALSSPEQGAQGGKIDINTASAQELGEALPGIGETLARRIVEYREQNGPFRSAEELMDVPGIGEKTFGAIRDLITAGQGPENSGGRGAGR